MKYVDLSYDIKSQMPVYPGDMVSAFQQRK